jgi:hypothetical protein
MGTYLCSNVLERGLRLCRDQDDWRGIDVVVVSLGHLEPDSVGLVWVYVGVPVARRIFFGVAPCILVRLVGCARLGMGTVSQALELRHFQPSPFAIQICVSQSALSDLDPYLASVPASSALAQKGRVWCAVVDVVVSVQRRARGRRRYYEAVGAHRRGGGGRVGGRRVERRGGAGLDAISATRALRRRGRRRDICRSHRVGAGPDQAALELRLAPQGAEFMQLEELVRVSGSACSGGGGGHENTTRQATAGRRLRAGRGVHSVEVIGPRQRSAGSLVGDTCAAAVFLLLFLAMDEATTGAKMESWSK